MLRRAAISRPEVAEYLVQSTAVLQALGTLLQMNLPRKAALKRASGWSGAVAVLYSLTGAMMTVLISNEMTRQMSVPGCQNLDQGSCDRKGFGFKP